jgi:hypothetical protein
VGIIIKKIAIENYEDNKQPIFSKLIRGGLIFDLESHVTDGGKHVQIILKRQHPRFDEFLEKAKTLNFITEQKNNIELNTTVLRFGINDQFVMIDGGGNTTIQIIEENFNEKSINISDFAKGKVRVVIDINFENPTSNTKLKTELKKLMEDTNEK